MVLLEVDIQLFINMIKNTLLFLIFLFVLCINLSYSDIIPSEQDVANHTFIGAALTKVVDAAVKDDGTTFFIMSSIFIGKELLDMDKTGFSINDLVYDYFGYILIKFKLEF